MNEKILSCNQCGKQFVVSGKEIERLFEKGFSLPRRCPECRKKKLKGMADSENIKNNRKKRHDRRRIEEDYY